MNPSKRMIIEMFRRNVKGKTPNVMLQNRRHDGRYGHWLEQQFGIAANASNTSDILGYELKNETSSKTTFGDWSANRYIFKHGKYVDIFHGSNAYERQNDFCRIFGKPNIKKGGRYSWSGTPCPRIDRFNVFGQRLIVEESLDIVAIYSYSEDRRSYKNEIVPEELRVENLEIARWYGVSSPIFASSERCLKDKLESKFNNLGWFTCKTDENRVYNKICFGDPIDYEKWIELVQRGVVFFDSGMYQGNMRPYSQWRADNRLWESLITDCYE